MMRITTKQSSTRHTLVRTCVVINNAVLSVSDTYSKIWHVFVLLLSFKAIRNHPGELGNERMGVKLYIVYEIRFPFFVEYEAEAIYEKMIFIVSFAVIYIYSL